MGDDRKAMYDGWSRTGEHTMEWARIANAFMTQAFASGCTVAKCPCKNCKNRLRQYRHEIQVHLCKDGFMPEYLVWHEHGELEHASESDGNDDEDRMDEMIADVGREYEKESPPEEVQKFFRLLAASDEKVHEGTNVTVLQAVTRLMAMKSKYNFANNCYNGILKLIIDLLPSNHKMPKDLYQSKKILAGLGMNYEKIDACENNCMLFWKEHENDTHCMHCNASRYVEVVSDDGEQVTTKVSVKQLWYMPITPRLKRLYLSQETAKQMRWHSEGKRESEDKDIMVHPSDGAAWQALDRFDPEFAKDSRNVRLGLSTDGFTPFSTSNSPYSCWPVFIMPYNLPPNMCMKEGYIFLAAIIPGHKHPGKKINVFMQPLIEELKELWQGVKAYDSHKKCEFTLRAAYLYSIHDLLAYGIWAGWCVHGKLCCPICMADTDAIWLKYGKKVSFFDCHRRFLPSNHPERRDIQSFRKGRKVTKGPSRRLTSEQKMAWHEKLKESVEGGFEGYGKEHNWTHISFLWELPYAKALLLPHNIDLMHQERNVAESIISMCFDFTGQTKDNLNARKDLADLCDRPGLEVRTNTSGNESRPRAPYCVKPEERKQIFSWLKTLKFPDRYAANIKRCVNLNTGKLNGLKSHDYHIMMERLVPVMFRGYFKPDLWKMLAELSYFYRQICAKEVSKKMMRQWEKEIVVLVCKMEKVFPPGFMNVMQHLLVHLPYEALVAGPAQFRWMYSQERELKKLRATVRNKARVEGCIAEAFAAKEITNFCSKYFSRSNNLNASTTRYHNVEEQPTTELQIFHWKGKGVGAATSHYISEEERNYTMLYLYFNMEELLPYFKMFDELYWTSSRRPTQSQLDKLRRQGINGGPNFVNWFRGHVIYLSILCSSIIVHMLIT